MGAGRSGFALGVVVGLAITSVGCGSSSRSSSPELVTVVPGPIANPLPPPTAAPACVNGDLVAAERVCGLGVVGRAYRWDDEKMRALAERRAARNLAGMLRSLVTSALVLGQDESSYWSRSERYIEIDEALVDRILRAADKEIWFDVLGEGPFRQPQRTYACACMSTTQAGIRVDPSQADTQVFARQYPVEEVPRWLVDVALQNEALKCAVGYHATMFHPEDMLGPLTDSVREQLVGKTRSWVLSEFDDRAMCKGRSPRSCALAIDSLVEAANEGVSRGVALTAVWFDTLGLGPNHKKMSAYGWGCVFDQAVLDAARRRLEEIRQLPIRDPVSSASPRPARR